MIKLSIQNLNMIYEEKTALDNVSFDVIDGEFLSILGPSGCGKSTILRILIGLLQPTSGNILKEGKVITNLPSSSRGMGIVFQNYALFEAMSVIKNVEYALKIRKENKSKEKREEVHKRALYILNELGLSNEISKMPSELSGGQQQRVAIARTLVMNPDIILFDEPMSALDVATRLSLRQEFKRIQNTFHSTMIYITHDQEEAFAMSDRIMIMDNAKIIQIDTPENILENPATEYVKDFVIKNLRLKLDSLRKYVKL